MMEIMHTSKTKQRYSQYQLIVTSADRIGQTLQNDCEWGTDILGFPHRIIQRHTASHWFSWWARTCRWWRGITLAISDAATATVEATQYTLPLVSLTSRSDYNTCSAR